MFEQSISGVLERWEYQGEMTLEMAGIIENNFDELMEHELGEINRNLSNQESDIAFARLTRLSSFINAASAKKPSIIRKLDKWVNKIKTTVNSLAKKLGAKSFSIGISMPFGLSIDLSFDIV
jgi:hypothetical protein